MIISDELKFIYIHIWRCGGNTINKQLYKYHNKEYDVFLRDRFHGMLFEAYEAIQKLGNNPKDYFVFSSIRSPFEMHYSLFQYNKKHLTLLPDGNKSPLSIKLGEKNNFNLKSFESYLKSYFQVPCPTLTDFLKDKDGNVYFNTIIKLENPTEGIEDIEKNIGIKLDLSSKVNSTNSKLWYLAYSIEAKNAVYRYHEHDFDFFRYAFFSLDEINIDFQNIINNAEIMKERFKNSDGWGDINELIKFYEEKTKTMLLLDEVMFNSDKYLSININSFIKY